MHGIFPTTCIRLAVNSWPFIAGFHAFKPRSFSPNFKRLSSSIPVTSPPPSTQYQFTAAQIARTAAKTIRAAVEEGKIRDAVHVTHVILGSSKDTRTRPFYDSAGLLKGFDSSRRIPSRLVNHSLVHALIRQGLFMDAASEIRQMISHGHRIRPRTVEITISLLCSAKGPLQIAQDRPSTDLPVRPDDIEPARLLAAELFRLPPGPHEALKTLMTARQFRRERTHEMFNRLLDACLLQGEILIGTLLFVLMVKDWQVRNVLKASKKQIEACLDSSTDDKTVERTKKQLKSLGFPNMEISKHLKSYIKSFVPFPSKSILQTILNSLNHHLLRRDSVDAQRIESIESLALLAELLREGSIPWGDVGPLIRTLQICPASPQVVTGLRRDGEYIEVDVYHDIHAILHQLCAQPPDARCKVTLENPRLAPPVDVTSYNALIRYSLRHRLSPSLANGLLDHMTNRREPPLSPNMSTYNTLLRSSTLINRNDYVAEILKRLGQREENQENAIVLHKAREVNLSSPTRRELLEEKGHITKLRRRIKDENLSLPDFGDSEVYAMDNCTLASYITHLVAIGRPWAVEELLFQLFPELHITLAEASRSIPLTEKAERRERCIARGVEYGPYVFSALLNAFSKAGKTGLVERLWYLAKQSEAASWDTADDSGQSQSHSKPWKLPIHAYTSVLQCYARESKKGLMLIHGSLHAPRWVHPPESSGVGRIRVKGWAYYVLRIQAQDQGFLSSDSMLRRETARKSGLLLYKAMQHEAISVWRRFQHISSDVKSEPEGPVPDEYFFNALLDVFGRRHNMQARRKSGRMSWWRRKLRIARTQYARHGILCTTYDTTLLDVARDMAAHGYMLPLPFQRVLIGRDQLIVNENAPKRAKVIPYAYPPPSPKNNQLFALPIVKERGLPLYQTSKTPRRGKMARRI